MRYLLALAVVCFLTLVPRAAGDRKELAFDTDRKGDIGLSKSEHVLLAQREIEDWEARIAQLKVSRSALPGDSPRYKLLDGAIVEMLGEVGSARAALIDLQSTRDPNWYKIVTRIDAGLAGAEQTHRSVLAE